MAGWDDSIFANLPPGKPLPGSPRRPKLPDNTPLMPVDPRAVVGGLYDQGAQGVGHAIDYATGQPVGEGFSQPTLGREAYQMLTSPTFGGGMSPLAGASTLAVAPLAARAAQASKGARTAEEIATGARAASTDADAAAQASRAAQASPGQAALDRMTSGQAAPSATEAAPAAKLFDYSGLSKVPDVPQFDLPRYNPPRGVSQRVQDIIANPDVRQQMLDTMRGGQQMGGADWYNADPLRQAFIDELGKQGDPRFQQYMNLVAATSNRSDVGTNVRNASFYYNRLVNGEPLPDVGTPNPQPYGHLAQRQHQANALEATSPEGWDVLQHPKPPSFGQNLMGNQQPVAVDAHAFKLPAMLAQDPRFLETGYQASKDAPKQNIQQMVLSGQMSMEDALKTPAYWQAQPKANEYGALEQYYKGLASDVNLTPGQGQASAWIKGGQTTGLASDANLPFIGFVEDRANKTADVRGLSPAEALSQFIRGKAPLLGVGGAGAAAIPWWQQYQQGQDQQGGGYGQPSA